MKRWLLGFYGYRSDLAFPSEGRALTLDAVLHSSRVPKACSSSRESGSGLLGIWFQGSWNHRG